MEEPYEEFCFFLQVCSNKIGLVFAFIFAIFKGVSAFLQRINQILSIGFIIAGFAFAIPFFKGSLLNSETRTKNFEKHFLWFAALIMLLSLAIFFFVRFRAKSVG